MTSAKNSPPSAAPDTSSSAAAIPTLRGEDAAIVARLRDAYAKVKTEMSKVVVGQQEIIEHLLIGLLCRGHVLLLGVPGLG